MKKRNTLLASSCPFLVWAVILTVALVPASSSQADNPPTQHTQILQTFEPARNDGMPLVQVRFSNTVIGTFAIDTGDYESVMTREFAAQLGQKPQTSITINSLGGDITLIDPYIQVPEIKLDNLTITGQNFRIMPKDNLPYIVGQPIDGLLGGDLLSRFALMIDYPNHQIAWITPGNLSDESAGELGFTPQERVELGQEHDPFDNSKVNHYSVRATFQANEQTQAADLYIDTGAPGTIIPRQVAQKLHLSALTTSMDMTLSDPLTPVNVSRVPQMQLGSLNMANVTVRSSQTDYRLPSLLGENVLSDCVVLFDFGPHHFYIRPVLPPVLGTTLPPVDRTTVDWDRLRRAPDFLTVDDFLNSGFAPDVLDDLPERIAPVRAAMTGTAGDIPRDEQLGALLRQGGDEAGARAAFGQAVSLSQAQVSAHPNDGEAAGQWVEALLLADRETEAVAAAQQAANRLPKFAGVWSSWGEALERSAIRLLVGPRRTVTQDQALKPYPLGEKTDHPLSDAEAQQVQARLLQARGCFNQAVNLAPQDPKRYGQRALYWIIDRGALSLLRSQGVKPKTVPIETVLALCFADIQQNIQFSPDDPAKLRGAALLDLAVPIFHDRQWLQTHLADTGRVLGPSLITYQAVQAHLESLAQSKDAAVAAPALEALGHVQQMQGKTHDAEDSWRRALALEPTQSDSLDALARQLRADGAWVDLRTLLTQQTTLKESVPTRLALAVELNAMNLSADGETQARAALKLEPDNATANLVLASFLLARSGADQSVLTEVSSCLDRASAGFGSLATPEQKASLLTMQSVWLALTSDPDKARTQLIALSEDQPTCTQAREAIAALTP